MICPVCKKDAVIVEYNNIELDYCPICGGVWFDSGELDMLLSAAELDESAGYLVNVIHSDEISVNEKTHNCPICRSKMKKVYIDKEKQIITDVCKGGHGIWFDRGEVTSLVKSLAKKTQEKTGTSNVLQFIGELFQHQS